MFKVCNVNILFKRIKLFAFLSIVVIGNLSKAGARADNDSTKHKLKFAMVIGKRLYFEKVASYESNEITAPLYNYLPKTLYVYEESFLFNSHKIEWYPTELWGSFFYKKLNAKVGVSKNDTYRAYVLGLGYEHIFKSGSGKIGASIITGELLYKNNITRIIYEKGYQDPNSPYITSETFEPPLLRPDIDTVYSNHLFYGGEVYGGLKIGKNWDLLASYQFTFRKHSVNSTKTNIISHCPGVLIRYHFNKTDKNELQKDSSLKMDSERIQIKELKYYFNLGFQVNLYDNYVFTDADGNFYFPANSYLSGMPTSLWFGLGILINHKWDIGFFFAYNNTEGVREGKSNRLNSFTRPEITSRFINLELGGRRLVPINKDSTLNLVCGISYQYSSRRYNIFAYDGVFQSIENRYVNYHSYNHSVLIAIGIRTEMKHAFVQFEVTAVPFNYVLGEYSFTLETWSDVWPGGSPHRFEYSEGKYSANYNHSGLNSRQYLLSAAIKFGYKF